MSQKRKRSQPTIDREAMTVSKSGPFLKQEYFNSCCGYELSLRQDVEFVVPKPLSLDLNVCTSEFIDGINPLEMLDDDDDRKIDLIALTGRSLGQIHTEIHLDEKQRNYFGQVKKEFEEYYGFIHGDFNDKNVQYKDDSLVIIDWHLSPLYERSANFDCVFRDVFWFSWALVFSSGMDVFKRKNLTRLLNQFVFSYVEQTNFPLAEIRKYTLLEIDELRELNMPSTKNARPFKAYLRAKKGRYVRNYLSNLVRNYWLNLS